MKANRILLSLMLLSAPVLLLSAGESSCVTCHTDMGGKLAAPVEAWQSSIHHDAGISCVDCHGGDAAATDPDKAMNPRKGFRGVPSPLKIPELCGSCHANKPFMKKFNPSIRVDQLELYKTSYHGKLLAKGDPHAATCVSCHGAHDILKPDDPQSPVYPTHVADTCGKCHADKALMGRYGISANVVAEYKKSVHARDLYKKGDLSAPTCNDCHGNHGAIPPNVKSIAFVCGTCHVINQELYDSSPLKAPWEAMGLGQCVVCHGNHDIVHPKDAWLDPQGKAVCKQCHDVNDDGYKAMAGMYDHIHKLDEAIRGATVRVKEASARGMLMDDASLLLQEAHSGLMKSRTYVHTFDEAKVADITKKGMKEADQANGMALKAFKDLQFRRKGLAIFFALAVLVAILMWLKIRQMEKTGKG
jgi:predicted CXXCH cytochrome family protein